MHAAIAVAKRVAVVLHQPTIHGVDDPTPAPT